MSQLLGLDIDSYTDLENYDDELVTVLSLAQAVSLASILGVPLRILLDENSDSDEVIPITDLPASIRSYVARERISLAEFEDAAGWEVGRFLDSPLQTALRCPVAFLLDVAGVLGVERLSVVPNEIAV